MAKKISVLVLGASGQLGQEFQYLAKEQHSFDFHFASKSEVDITSVDSISTCIAAIQPDYIINCAAYTAVDKAESDIEKCYLINEAAVKNIVSCIQGSETKLIHFSTDYVYNSYNGFPLHEDDLLLPNSVYAQSKLAGENAIRSSGVPAMIIRTSWVISSYARDLAQAVIDIMVKVTSKTASLTDFNDTYNYANEGIITWYDLATAVMNLSQSSCSISPIPSSEYPTPASRPSWSVLSKQKIKSTFDLQIPHWYLSTARCLAAMQDNN
jgi:dTDP-4-dehydrorhamnose reductase